MDSPSVVGVHGGTFCSFVTFCGSSVSSRETADGSAQHSNAWSVVDDNVGVCSRARCLPLLVFGVSQSGEQENSFARSTAIAFFFYKRNMFNCTGFSGTDLLRLA